MQKKNLKSVATRRQSQLTASEHKNQKKLSTDKITQNNNINGDKVANDSEDEKEKKEDEITVENGE